MSSAAIKPTNAAHCHGMTSKDAKFLFAAALTTLEIPAVSIGPSCLKDGLRGSQPSDREPVRRSGHRIDAIGEQCPDRRRIAAVLPAYRDDQPGNGGATSGDGGANQLGDPEGIERLERISREEALAD